MEDVVFNLSAVYGSGAALVLSLVFVISLYITPKSHNHNNPVVIKRRIVTVVLLSVLSPLYVWLLSDKAPNNSGYSLRHWIGLIHPTSSIPPLLLTIILFIGPLFQAYLDDDNILSHSINEPVFLRNIIFAPITEEVVFRGCMVPLLFPGFGWTPTIVILPLYFGIAHLHHGCVHIVGCTISIVLKSGTRFTNS